MDKRELLFYDIEVYGQDYFMCFLDSEGELKYFIHNTNEGLAKIFMNYRVIGYNNYHYDDFMCVMIMRGCSKPEDVKELNDRFIKGEISDEELRTYKRSYNNVIDTLDVSQQIEGSTIDMRTKKRYPPSLKMIMANKGRNIHESAISFDHPLPLTPDELQECVDYCINDVRETIPIYYDRESYWETKEYVISVMVEQGTIKPDVVKRFMKYNQTTLTGILIGELEQWTYDVENHKVPEEWIKHWQRNYNKDVKPSLAYEEFDNKIEVSFGGCHGWNRNLRSSKEGIWHIDVGGMYPNLLLRDNILKSKGPLLKQFVARRDEIKYLAERMYQEGADKEAISRLEKESTNIKVGVNNSLYGILNSKYSNVYNPGALFQICANGHEAIYNLAKLLSPYGRIAQINTDGIYFVEDRPGWREELSDWESEFQLSLDVDRYEFYSAQHMSRYITKDPKGKVKCKGMNPDGKNYYKTNNFAIVDRCVREYIVNGTDPMDTILDNANELILFQYVTKFGRQFELVYHNGNEEEDQLAGQKVNRFFVTSNARDSEYVIRKRKKIEPKEVEVPVWEEYITKTGNTRRRRVDTKYVIKNYQYTMFSMLPENITLYNGSLEDITPQDLNNIQLDYGYYYELAQAAIKQFETGTKK